MSSILFITFDGGGNVPPATGIAKELARRGHSVRFMGHPSQKAVFAESQFEFVEYKNAHPFAAAEGGSTWTIMKVFGDRGMGADVVSEVRRTGPDLVVVDCLMFGVLAALQDARIPYVTFEHSLDGSYRQAFKGPLAAIMRLKGFPLTKLFDGSVLTICPTQRELDFNFGRVVHTGAVVHGIPAAPTEPTLLVSLSTFSFKPLRKRWNQVLEAVDGLDARIIATTGPAIDPAALTAPKQVELHQWLPHNEVMPSVSAVLGHGGHATALTALAHGVPLVVVPVDSRTDQPFVAKAVERAGVGLAPGTRPANIRAAVERVMADKSIRSAAAALGEQIRANPGHLGAADALEAVVLGSDSAGLTGALRPSWG